MDAVTDDLLIKVLVVLGLVVSGSAPRPENLCLPKRHWNSACSIRK